MTTQALDMDKSSQSSMTNAGNIHMLINQDQTPSTRTEQTPSTDAALCKRVIHLEASEAALTLEQNRLQQESQQLQRKLDVQCRDGKALERQVHDLRLQRSEGDKKLKKQIAALTAQVNGHEDVRLQAYQSGVIEGVRTQSTPTERAIMLQQADAYKAEAMRWKSEAFRQGSRVISQCWQASVDEAVRREREKDSAVIKALRDEIATLRAEKKAESAMVQSE